MEKSCLRSVVLQMRSCRRSQYTNHSPLKNKAKFTRVKQHPLMTWTTYGSPTQRCDCHVALLLLLTFAALNPPPKCVTIVMTRMSHVYRRD